MVEHRFESGLKTSTGWGLFWYSVAGALHVAAVASLIYFTPLRQWFLDRREAEQPFSSIEGARMSRIAESLIHIHTKRIRMKVAQQREVLAELERVRDTRHEQYAQEAEQARKRNPTLPAPERLEALGPAGPNTDIPLAGKDVCQLYDIALLVEQATYGTYRQMRAVELARVQGIALTEAMEATKVAVPLHDTLDRDVFEMTIISATDGKLEALKQELFKAHAEISSMLAAGLRMLDMANELMAGDVGGVRVVAIGGGGFNGGGGSGGWGSDIGPPLSPHEFYPGGTSGNFDASFRPAPGRKLMDDGTKAEWMYLDTWYIIGPFPNPNRMNLDTKFPPESAVDLDATYVGKDGLRLRWQFIQSYRLMIAPIIVDRNAIWYGYTQIYSDREREQWAIFGSDDYSKAWLNGELIWTSGKTPHHWIPDRGYRKLTFRKGYNLLLVKLENAGGTTGYSVAIYLGDVAS